MLKLLIGLFDIIASIPAEDENAVRRAELELRLAELEYEKSRRPVPMAPTKPEDKERTAKAYVDYQALCLELQKRG